jgi:hypothetical protein
MTAKLLKIKWTDGTTVDLELANNPVADFYYSCIRRLQKLDLLFGPRETPYHPLNNDIEQSQQLLQAQLTELGIDVDINQLHNQTYLNYLHDIYFQQCNTQDRKHYTKWTYAHDTIHLLETHNQHRNKPSVILFNYRNDAGLLYKKFDRSYLQYAVHSVIPGTCFLTEQELGKNPLTYYFDQEPNDIDFMCKVCKPWINLIPTLNIAMQPTSPKPIPDDFIQWFALYKDQWCQHWGITDWHPDEMSAKIPIGRILNFDELQQRFKNNNYPNRLTQ